MLFYLQFRLVLAAALHPAVPSDLTLDPFSACFPACSAFSLTSCSALLSVLPLDPTSTLSLFQPSTLTSVLLSNLSLAPLSALHVALPAILSPVLPSTRFTSAHVEIRYNELCLHQCVRAMF